MSKNTGTWEMEDSTDRVQTVSLDNWFRCLNVMIVIRLPYFFGAA